MAFSPKLANELQQVLEKKPCHIDAKKNKKMALNSVIQTNQILTNDDEVCLCSICSIFVAVPVINGSVLVAKIWIAIFRRTGEL